MAKAMDVVRLFLSWANRDGDLITNLKMQKMLYYAEAWHLVNFSGRSLFPEPIEAWEFGPVVPPVWQRLKQFGSMPIKYRNQGGQEEQEFSSRQLRYLQEFYRVFMPYTAHALVNMSHNEAPWIDAHERGVGISRDVMRAFYSETLRQQQRHKHAHA
jgi:uncharacterized phage-associated protein